MQGFLFSRPVPAHALAAAVARIEPVPTVRRIA
jgi:EAL domain-containing protein (putative c-di-GMP-specific phosphodiesterase class I)